ncbi:MAG: hypothetical protein ILA23_05450 [Bacteroidales bacterium]|nr:hypothetical protein [Bacteroidales bacterium]
MKLTDLKGLRVIKKSLSPEPEKAPVQNQPSLLSKWGSSSPYNLDNLSTKWTIWHFYGDKKSIIPALVLALQYP